VNISDESFSPQSKVCSDLLILVVNQEPDCQRRQMLFQASSTIVNYFYKALSIRRLITHVRVGSILVFLLRLRQNQGGGNRACWCLSSEPLCGDPNPSFPGRTESISGLIEKPSYARETTALSPS